MTELNVISVMKVRVPEYNSWINGIFSSGSATYLLTFEIVLWCGLWMLVSVYCASFPFQNLDVISCSSLQLQSIILLSFLAKNTSLCDYFWSRCLCCFLYLNAIFLPKYSYYCIQPLAICVSLTLIQGDIDSYLFYSVEWSVLSILQCGVKCPYVSRYIGSCHQMQ